MPTPKDEHDNPVVSTPEGFGGGPSLSSYLDRVRSAAGVVDGANVDFSTPTPYVPGSLVVFENGRLLQAELDNGFLEGTPPAFSLKIAPRPGSYVQVAYFEEP